MKYDQRDQCEELFEEHYRGCANCKHARYLDQKPKIVVGERFAAACSVFRTDFAIIQIRGENTDTDLPICGHWAA